MIADVRIEGREVRSGESRWGVRARRRDYRHVVVRTRRAWREAARSRPCLLRRWGAEKCWLELSVAANGSVGEVATLRETPPYTEELRARVAQWSFTPAQEGARRWPRTCWSWECSGRRRSMEPAIGEPPRDVAAASAEVAVPTQDPMPIYPANAVGDAMVLVEAAIGVDGKVGEVRSVAAGLSRSRPPRWLPCAAGSFGPRRGRASRCRRRCASWSASVLRSGLRPGGPERAVDRPRLWTVWSRASRHS